MAKTTYDWEGITPLAYELLPRYLAANKIYDQNDAQGVYDALGNLINGLNSNNYNMELSGAITGAPNSTEYRHAATILNAVRDSVAKKAVTEPEKKKWDDKILQEALLTTAFGNAWTRGERSGQPMATASMWQLWRDRDALGSDGKRGKENRKKALVTALQGVIKKIDEEYGDDEEAKKIKNILATAIQTNTPQYAHTLADWLLSDELPAKNEGSDNGGSGQNPTQTGSSAGTNPANPANPTSTETPEGSDWQAFLETTPDFESESFIMGRPDTQVLNALLLEDDQKHRRLISDYFSDKPAIETERIKYYSDPYVFDKTTNVLTPNLEDYQWRRAKDRPHEFWDQVVDAPLIDSGGWNAYDPAMRAWNKAVKVDPEYADVYGDNTRPGDAIGWRDNSVGMSERAWRQRNLTNMLQARHSLNLDEDAWRRFNETQEISEIDLKNNGIWIVDFGSVASGGDITRKFVGFKKFFSDENIPDATKQLIKDTILQARAKATEAKKNGGIIKALSGVKIKKTEPTQEEMLLSEPKDDTARTMDQVEYQNQKANDSRKEFTGVDKARLATVALDTIGLISSLFPTGPGLAISGATGLASTGLTLGLDIADPTVSKGQVLTNLGMNAALTLGGLVPGIGKVAQAKKLATGLRWFVKALGGAAAVGTMINCGPEAMSAIQKVLDGRISAVTVGEMKSLAYTLGAAAGLGRTGRNTVKRRYYDSKLNENPSGYTLKDVSATKTVKAAEGAGETKTDIKASITLTPEEAARIDAAGKKGGQGSALSELNAIAKSRPELKDVEFTALPDGTTYVPPILRRFGAGALNKSITNSAEIAEATPLAERIKALDKEYAEKAGKSFFKTDYEILRYGNQGGWSPFAGSKIRALRRQAKNLNQPGQAEPVAAARGASPAEEAVRENAESKVEEAVAAAEAKTSESTATEAKASEASVETKVTEEAVKEAATAEAVEKVAEETGMTPAAVEEAAGGSAVTEAIAAKAAETSASSVKANRTTAKAYNKIVAQISREIKNKINKGKGKGVNLSIRGSKNWRDKHTQFTLDQMDKAGNFEMFAERPITGKSSLKTANKKLFWKLLRNEKDVPFVSARPLTYDPKTRTWFDARRNISYGESPFNSGDIRGMKVIGNSVFAYDRGGQIRYFYPGGSVDKYGYRERDLYDDEVLNPKKTVGTTTPSTTPVTNPASTASTTSTTTNSTTSTGTTSATGYAPKAATDPLESWHSPYPDLDYSDLKYNISTIGTMAGAGLSQWAMTNRDLAEKAKLGAKRTSFMPSMPEKVYRRNIKNDSLANQYASKLDSSYNRALGLGSDALTSTTAFNAQRANLLQNQQENEQNELTRMNSISEANQAQRYTEAKARLTTMDANREAARLLKNSILDERAKNNSRFLSYNTNLAKNVFTSLQTERNYQNKKALSDWTTKFNLSAINHLSPNTLKVYNDNPTYRDLLMQIYGMQGAEAADNMASYLQNALSATPAPVVTPATTNK